MTESRAVLVGLTLSSLRSETEVGSISFSSSMLEGGGGMFNSPSSATVKVGITTELLSSSSSTGEGFTSSSMDLALMALALKSASLIFLSPSLSRKCSSFSLPPMSLVGRPDFPCPPTLLGRICSLGKR